MIIYGTIYNHPGLLGHCDLLLAQEGEVSKKDLSPENQHRTLSIHQENILRKNDEKGLGDVEPQRVPGDSNRNHVDLDLAVPMIGRTVKR